MIGYHRFEGLSSGKCRKCGKSGPTLVKTAANAAWHSTMRFTSNWQCGQGLLLRRSIRISEMLP